MYLETDVKMAKKEYKFDCKQARRLKQLSGETDENLKYRFVCVWVTWVCAHIEDKNSANLVNNITNDVCLNWAKNI